MPILAAIDVGSNAMRLIVAEADAERHLTTLESIREPVRLGQDVFTSGTLSEETTDLAITAFRKFKSTIDLHGANWIKAVGTSAIREALNRDFFVDRIAQASGIDLTIIGAEEEARLIFLAVAEKVPLKNKLAMLIDIGGGSTEITLVSDGNIISTQSLSMGSVRLMNLLEEKKHGERQFNQLLGEYVDASQKRIKKEIGNERIDICIGTGGNIETLVELNGQSPAKDREATLSEEEISALLKQLSGLSFEERVQQLGLRPDRADVIVPATVVLRKIMKQANVKELVVPRVGLKDGLLLDMLEELYGDAKHRHQGQAIASAIQLGRKYMFDEQHARTVAKCAVGLFDETKPLHNLPLENRLLLEVAALLHDIGNFVAGTDHHKHTLYLLMSSPLIGLTPSQMTVIANIARYHRKSPPKTQHDAYRMLSSKERVTVSKLAALLRLADAMDNEHASKVTSFSVEYKKPKFVLRLAGEGDLLLEKWALMKKAAMFEEVFSVKFSVEDAAPEGA